ncbi:MAG TPA: hypothetical protein VNW97_07480 [Candidatus Saccharimonadales bacterium]|jgi:hypothetical protein|nr:hypothetical protein [Candidatus Saccharimonadales bacterium]
MKATVHLLLVLGLSVHAVAALPSCSPIPGTEQIWSKASVRWVFIGEVHGSNETPAAFLDLVCDALANGKHVSVALERPTSEQAALDGILTAKNLADAEALLLRQPGWKEELDGRSSEAMLRLLRSLRELRATHPDLQVFAFDAPYTGTVKGARDQALGKTLLAIGEARPHDLVLILAGNVHGMEAPMFGYDLAAMYIPAAERMSLQVTDKGGESWVKGRGRNLRPRKGGRRSEGRRASAWSFSRPRSCALWEG